MWRGRGTERAPGAGPDAGRGRRGGDLRCENVRR